jgi:flavin-dependent dehydrogenase
VEQYDVIIVGGGPAGLKCAEELGKTDLRVLLLEKGEIFGDKLCAGGITLKDMSVLPVPDEVIEHKISRASIHSRKRRADTLAPAPFLFTLNRKDLGEFQRNLLDDTDVHVMTNSQVTRIEPNKVILKDGREYAYRYLVGAEGYASLVRRYLKLPAPKKLIGFQYTIPTMEVDPVLHIFMDWRKFGAWYAWIFPHRDSIAVGCCCDPDLADHLKLRDRFHQWLKEKNIDPGNAKLESCPIAYGYSGVCFENIFLVGEAAGLASGFTGEGIYQSLVSGQEVAAIILDPSHEPTLLKEVIKYNKDVHGVWRILRLAGPLKGLLHELLVFLMNRKWIRDKINSGFSK